MAYLVGGAERPVRSRWIHPSRGAGSTASAVSSRRAGHGFAQHLVLPRRLHRAERFDRRAQGPGRPVVGPGTGGDPQGNRRDHRCRCRSRRRRRCACSSRPEISPPRSSRRRSTGSPGRALRAGRGSRSRRRRTGSPAPGPRRRAPRSRRRGPGPRHRRRRDRCCRWHRPGRCGRARAAALRADGGAAPWRDRGPRSGSTAQLTCAPSSISTASAQPRAVSTWVQASARVHRIRYLPGSEQRLYSSSRLSRRSPGAVGSWCGSSQPGVSAPVCANASSTSASSARRSAENGGSSTVRSFSAARDTNASRSSHQVGAEGKVMARTYREVGSDLHLFAEEAPYCVEATPCCVEATSCSRPAAAPADQAANRARQAAIHACEAAARARDVRACILCR